MEEMPIKLKWIREGEGVGDMGIDIYTTQQWAEGMCLSFQSQLVRKKIPVLTQSITNLNLWPNHLNAD